jgi:AraC-like DNA-binding protein
MRAGTLVLNQSDMVTLGDPAAGDRGRFRVLPGFGGTAIFDADFHNFVFAPHFHDTLMLGLIVEGEKRFVRDRTLHTVTVGGLSVVNPGDIHTGGVVGDRRRLRYTAVYPGSAMLLEAGLPASADFRPAVVEDPSLVSVFARALSSATPDAEAEEALLIALTRLASRHGSADNSRRQSHAVSHRAVRRAVEYIQAHVGNELRLEEIARHAEIGPRHLIRCFGQVLGLTPQDYVRQARVQEVACQLRRGEPAAFAAAAAGFADQPHMTRAFRMVMGITPAAYARSWGRGHHRTGDSRT